MVIALWTESLDEITIVELDLGILVQLIIISRRILFQELYIWFQSNT